MVDQEMDELGLAVRQLILTGGFAKLLFLILTLLHFFAAFLVLLVIGRLWQCESPVMNEYGAVHQGSAYSASDVAAWSIVREKANSPKITE
jgi:hypothetical protein